MYPFRVNRVFLRLRRMSLWLSGRNSVFVNTFIIYKEYLPSHCAISGKNKASGILRKIELATLSSSKTINFHNFQYSLAFDCEKPLFLNKIEHGEIEVSWW